MRREVVVNGRFLSRRVTGVERVGREALQWLRGRCRVETTRVNGMAGHVWEQFILPSALKAESVLWSPANTGPLFVRNQALTIHDLSPLEHPEWFQPGFAIWYCLLLPVLAKRVRLIFAPSEYVKRKIMERFGVERVIVAPNGIDTSVFRPDVRRDPDLPTKYILFVGSIQPRKNLEGLLKTWREIKAEFKDTWLVIAGESGHVFRAVKFSDDEHVLFLNYAPEENLPSLYAHADCFVLPSFDEGFGLTALEALACGTPVIVSDGGALPETIGDAGLIFKLSESYGLTNVLKECLSNSRLREPLKEKGLARAKQFSWRDTAELIWTKMNEL